MRIFLLLCCLFMFIAPTSAQDDAPIPLDDALNTTPIPPRDRIDLAQRFDGVTADFNTVVDVPAWEIGDVDTFYVSNTSDDQMTEVPATLMAMGEHIYLWVESEYLDEVDVDDLEALAQAFDDDIYPDVRELWGSEPTPGIDGDPRIYGLFTRAVGGDVAAYYMGDNVYPRSIVETSNERDMFFFNLDAFTFYSRRDVESVVAHEFQHMIRRNLQINEETWMNEGFSVFTQNLLYPPAGYEVQAFLYFPQAQLNNWYEDSSLRVVNYGASGLFITYFYERYGLEAIQQLSADSAPRGLQAFEDVLISLGEPGVDVFFADFVVANLVQDSDAADGRYGYTIVETSPDDVFRDEVDEYPTLLDDVTNQYGTRYYDLDDPPDVLTLDVTIPRTVGIIPTEAASGDHFWYSNRADMSDTTLTHAFDLTGVDSATLEFNVWYHFEEFWDFGHITVSTDNGATWTILVSDDMTTDNPYNTAYGAGYTGMSGALRQADWIKQTIPLDDYAGQDILLRFEAITDDAVNQPGMAIDDIRIPEIGYSSDFEADNGGWDGAGWLWTDNILQQRAWIQIIEQKDDDVRVTRWLVPDDGTTLTVDLVDDSDVTMAISGLAPVTTVELPYLITVDEGE